MKAVAVTGPGGGAEATQVMPGEMKAFRFKATHPGLYVYHCATPYIPAHIANGMYGMLPLMIKLCGMKIRISLCSTVRGKC